MRRPISHQILIGILLLFGASTVLIIWLANNYKDCQLDIEIDNFFVSTSLSYNEAEAEFSERLHEVKKYIITRMVNRAPKLNSKINNAISTNGDRQKKISRVAKFFLHKRLLEVRKKFPFINNDKLLTFEYTDLHQFWNKYDGGYLKQPQIDKLINSVSSSTNKGKYSLANILTSIYTKRAMGNKNVEYFYDSIKSMHGIQFDPSKADFQTIEVLGASREFLFFGLNLNNAIKDQLITYKEIISRTKERLYIGFLACKLNLIDVYEKLPNVYPDLDSTLNKFDKFEILNASNQATGDSIELNDLKGLLKVSQGALRLRAYDLKNRPFYINVIKETRYNKYFHIFIYEAHARYALYVEELKHYLTFYLIIIMAIVIIAIGIGRGLASPLRELSELVQQSSVDLQTTSLSKMSAKFIEIFVLRQVFTSQIDKLRDEFTMSSKLVDFQEFLLKRPTSDEAKSKLQNLLVEYCDENTEITEILEIKPTNPNKLDNDFYLEWCRYNDSLLLERDFRTASQKRKEFKLAQDIQHQLLPRQDLQNKNVHCYYLAARYLGGDFYDLLSIGSKTYFLIADVSGKGLPSALFGAAAKFFLNVQLKAKQNIEHTMKITNNYLCGLQQQGFFCTLFLASWNPETRTLNYCSAGHNKMYLLTPKIQELNANGLPLGFIDMANYEMGQFEDVPEDSLLVLYTDGVTEAENLNQELFDNLRLERLLLENSAKAPSIISEEIIDSLKDFTEDAEQSDDITYVLARL